MEETRLPKVLDDLPDRTEDPDMRAAVEGDLARLLPLQEALGYRFARPALLRVAVTLGSWTHEHPRDGWPSNACLEFFGDAVLDLLAADDLWRRFPRLAEGQLTRLRASLVSEPTLAAVAREIDLGTWLFLSRGQAMQGGRGHAGTLADAVEAILGAVFLDAREAGLYPLEAAGAVFEHLLGERVRSLRPDHGLHPKARLQQWAQGRYRVAPVYIRVGERPAADDPHWRVRVQLIHPDGTVDILGDGEGRSLRRAESAAAEQALERIDATSETDEEEY